MVYYSTMKTLALMLVLVLSVNSNAAVCISDSTPYEVDPWEIQAVEEAVVEEPVMATSGSFSA